MQKAVVSGQERLMTSQQFSEAVCGWGTAVNHDLLHQSGHRPVGGIKKLASFLRTRQVVVMVSFDLPRSRMTGSEQDG